MEILHSNKNLLNNLNSVKDVTPYRNQQRQCQQQNRTQVCQKEQQNQNNSKNVVSISKRPEVLSPPKVINYTKENYNNINLNFQFSIHRPGKFLNRDLKLIFPNIGEEVLSNLKILPIFFKASVDLVAVNERSNLERNFFLEEILAIAAKLKKVLNNYFLDLTDPASGYPVYSDRGCSLYPDVDGSVRLLKYDCIQAGCCRVIVHPQWGTKNYPCSIFTDAPVDVIFNIFDNFHQL
ncbi:hypothetical protein HK099_000011 [Clydaea vesicula]|uniref:Methylmalonic aciduria and homocystinuria type D protein n=1 Tax=Clydaea vesicula TaxID=447962 RepID=A0AAD5U9K9_9FUNG|nr:hypothetical protein HK099_000011 [Clydaea vesicula]